MLWKMKLRIRKNDIVNMRYPRLNTMEDKPPEALTMLERAAAISSNITGDFLINIFSVANYNIIF